MSIGDFFQNIKHFLTVVFILLLLIHTSNLTMIHLEKEINALAVSFDSEI